VRLNPDRFCDIGMKPIPGIDRTVWGVSRDDKFDQVETAPGTELTECSASVLINVSDIGGTGGRTSSESLQPVDEDTAGYDWNNDEAAAVDDADADADAVNAVNAVNADYADNTDCADCAEDAEGAQGAEDAEGAESAEGAEDVDSTDDAGDDATGDADAAGDVDVDNDMADDNNADEDGNENHDSDEEMSW